MVNCARRHGNSSVTRFRSIFVDFLQKSFVFDSLCKVPRNGQQVSNRRLDTLLPRPAPMLEGKTSYPTECLEGFKKYSNIYILLFKEHVVQQLSVRLKHERTALQSGTLSDKNLFIIFVPTKNWE